MTYPLHLWVKQVLKHAMVCIKRIPSAHLIIQFHLLSLLISNSSIKNFVGKESHVTIIIVTWNEFRIFRSLYIWRRNVWMDKPRRRRWLRLDIGSRVGQFFYGSSKRLLQLFSRISYGRIRVHWCRISPKTRRSSLPFFSFLRTDRYYTNRTQTQYTILLSMYQKECSKMKVPSIDKRRKMNLIPHLIE